MIGTVLSIGSEWVPLVASEVEPSFVGLVSGPTVREFFQSTLLQASGFATIAVYILIIAVIAAVIRAAVPVYEGGYDAETAPPVGATARVVERVTPVAGKAVFHSGFEDRQLPVRTDGGSIDIGEQIVVVDHGPDGMPLVDAGTPPIVEGSGPNATSDAGAAPDADGDPSETAGESETWAKPAVGRTSTYEVTTEAGGRYELEVGPVLDEDVLPPAHHDGTMLEAVSETVERLDETSWTPEWIATEQYLWIEHVETLEEPTETDEADGENEAEETDEKAQGSNRADEDHGSHAELNAKRETATEEE
jgi:hypothetical protein